MFTVYFHNATTTPSQPGLRQLVQAALTDRDAEWTGMEAELRLADGAKLYLFGEDEDAGMLAEYPELTDEVAATLFAIMQRTHCFLLGVTGDPDFVRMNGGVGDPQGVLADIPPIHEVDREELQNLLSRVPPDADARPPLPSPPRPARGPSSSLMDFLFGKPG